MARSKLRILILIIISIILVKTLFIQTNEQKYIVKASNDPITAEPGSDVILPCHLEPPFDVSTLLVEWTRDSEIVHLSRRGYDFPEEQDPWFKDRTQLFRQEMKYGNIALKLFKVTKEDEGTYTCSVPKLEGQVREGLVTLIIVEPGSEKKVRKNPDEEPKNNKDSKGLGSGGISAKVIIIIISAIVFWLR